MEWPTAQALVGDSAVTELTKAPAGPVRVNGGHTDPSQCHSAGPPASGPSTTAQASLPESALTAMISESPEGVGGSGAGVQFVPSQCSISQFRKEPARV